MAQKYSGKQISKAGENLLKEELTKNKKLFSETMDILSFWRFSHATPLEKAFSYLQEITLAKDKKAIFAKRLKRHISIEGKLRRFRKMKLNRMQDIGGCRVVLSTQKKLTQVERELRKSQYFKDKTGQIRYKDYIEKPKSDGYRSIHIMGKFPDSIGATKTIEIQLRTFIQHYWATAVEIVDLFTDQALKSNQGDDEWKVFFIRVSEQFATMDSIHLFNNLPKEERNKSYTNFVENNEKLKESCRVAQLYCERLDVFEKLNVFAGSLEYIDEKLNSSSSEEDVGYILLIIDMKKRMLTSKVFSISDSQNAESEYIEAEKRASEDNTFVVALVSTTAVGDIKDAYPNFFADSSKFMEHLDLIMSVYFPDTISVYNQTDFINKQLINIVEKSKS